jgi:hypothetical protein
LRCILLTPMETDMSNIDKDSKSKVAKPTDRKFLLGLLDGYLPHNKSMLVGLAVSSILRRGK